MPRSYRMLCPISRALDRVGDRWTLLILRDLHAGPMRFGDLQKGLPGLASNLLASRLEKLVSDRLVARDSARYALTDSGRSTDRVLWELARLGMSFEPDEDLKRPGHLRLAAVTLQNAMKEIGPPPTDMVAELILDGESFSIVADGEDVRVRYGAPDDPVVTVTTAYEPMMLAIAGGESAVDAFRAEHLHATGPKHAVQGFQGYMRRVLLEAFPSES